MLLDRLDNYISEVEKHDKVWKGVTASGFTVDELMQMTQEERDQIMDILDDKTINSLKKLEEGGLL